MPGYPPEDREIFESEALGLYESAVKEQGIRLDDPRIADGGATRRGFELLVRMGLLHRDAEAQVWLPADPAAAQSQVVAPLGQEGTRLIEESARWAKTLGALGNTWRRAPQPEDTSGLVTYLHGLAISPFLNDLVADAEEELLTAQPQTGRDPQSMAAGVLRDIDALERGVRMRTLYQHSARRDAVTHKYVARVTAAGAEVRTLDEFFNRLIVVDRRVAVIPGADGLATAVVVRDPAVVAYLVDVFDRAFARARPFTSTERTVTREIAAEQRAMTIRMLAEGHADVISAKRLGVSPRTYAGYVAELKEEYDAESRFQLGYTLGRLGVTGNDEGEPPPTEGGPDA
ncbi:LuxR family transcriptional regulator [Nocardioides sp. GY 10113]|uniref:LuxR family transcriptional regulator n=1 Tax=Nocardioides sp. GY 10113 TaxID=2569761 RepID=UPI0010A77ADB|nr:LuxR family transcriptional regulator [Nocardioides sp. GY 10113]TIC82211.1 LuxR family transcriptional regulator [Nocardioides sp. GY 10113]